MLENDAVPSADIVAAGMRPLLMDLVAKAIDAGSVDAALPHVEKVVRFLSAEYVASMCEVALHALNEGLKSGLERAGSPLQ